MQPAIEQNETKMVLQVAELLPNTIKMLLRHISAMTEPERLALLKTLNEEMHRKEQEDFFERTGLNLIEEENRIDEIVSNDRKTTYERTVNR